jgi:hypothetical protein
VCYEYLQRIEASQALDAGSIPITPPSCYKSSMSNTIEQWLVFKFIGLEFTPLSKPFKTKEQAEKAREIYPGAFAQEDWARCDSYQDLTDIDSVHH